MGKDKEYLIDVFKNLGTGLVISGLVALYLDTGSAIIPKLLISAYGFASVILGYYFVKKEVGHDT